MIILIPDTGYILSRAVKFASRGRVRSNILKNSPEPAKEMSSTLFGRGTNTQVGGRRRAEEVENAIRDIRTSIQDVKEVPNELRAFQAKVMALESKVAGHDQTLKHQSERIDTADASGKNALYQTETQIVVIKNLQAQVDTLTTLLKSLQGQVDAQAALIKALSAETAAD